MWRKMKEKSRFYGISRQNLVLNNSSAYSQSGSILLWVLIAVALLGYLTFTFTQNTRSNTTDLTKEKTQLLVSEITAYAQQIRSGVQSLLISGCLETEINFDNPIVAGYTNAGAPGDGSCDVFSGSGANLNYQRPNLNALDFNQSGHALYGQWYFPEGTCVKGLGTGGDTCWTDADNSNEDLVLILPFVSKTTCIALNNALGIGTPDADPPEDTGRAWPDPHPKFTGTFVDGNRIDSEASTASDIIGKPSGCIEGDTNPPAGTYHYYLSLITR